MQLSWGLNSSQIRNRLVMLTLCLSAISIITEYLVEVVLALSTNVLLVDVLNLFSVNLEESIPTWYSTILLFVAAVLLTFIALVKFRELDGYRWQWLGLAVGFVYLSIDEGAGIHELFVDPLKLAFNPTGFFAFGWQIVAIPVVLVVMLLYTRFIFQLPTRSRLWLIFSGGLYLGGALIVEGISANQWDINDGISMVYLSIATIEELFEMLGVVLFIYTLLDYMEQAGYSFAIHHAPSTAPPQKTHDRRVIPRMISLLIIINIVLLGWMIGTSQPLLDSSESQDVVIAPFYYAVQDQILANEGVIIETHGIFGIDNQFSRQLGATLLEQYTHVIAIAQPTRNATTLLATNTPPLSRDDLTDLLHGVGQTNFIIFETETVRAISQLP